MVQELLVVAARPLPFEGKPFELKLGSSEGIEVHQLIHPVDIDVGFSPRVVLSLVPANVKSHAVAAALASALDGVAPSPTGDDGLQALVLAEAAFRSNRDRRTVDVSEI